MNGDWVSGPETLTDERDGRQPLRSRARPISPIRSTTSITRPCFRIGRRSRCRCCRPPTGAGSRCIRAAISRASTSRRRSRSGSKCTASSIGRTTTPTTASTLQKKFFDYFLKGEKNGWDKQPRVQLNVRHPGREVRHPSRGRLADPAHAMDEVPSRGRRRTSSSPSRPKASATVTFDALGDGVTFLTEPMAKDDRDHRPGRRQACTSRRRPRTPISSWCCACSRPT